MSKEKKQEKWWEIELERQWNNQYHYGGDSLSKTNELIFIKNFISKVEQRAREEVTIELNNAYLEDQNRWRERHFEDARKKIREMIEKMKSNQKIDNGHV